MASNLQSVQTLRLDQAINEDMAIVPVSKLDADQYSVDDLDGVTEGLFGSGSVGYASLQAAQTDELMAANLAMDQASEQGGGDIAADENAHYTPIAEDNAPKMESVIAAPGNGASPTDTDRALDSGANPVSEVKVGEGGIGGSSTGAVGASQLSSGAGSFAPSGSGLNLNDGLGSNGIPGTGGSGTNGGGTVSVTEIPAPPVAPGQPGTSGVNGLSGINGLNGQDGDGGGDVTILGDVINDIDETLIDLGDTINNITDVLQEITNKAGDIINNLTDLDLITEVKNTVTNLTEVVNKNITEITNILKDLPLLNDPFSLNLNSLDLLGGHLSGTVPGLLTGDYVGRLDVPTVDNLMDFLSDQLADRTGIDALSDALGTLGGAAQQAQDAIAGITDALGGLQNAEDLSDVLNTLSTSVGSVTDLVDGAVGEVLDTLGLGDIGGGILEPVLDMADGLLADPVGTLDGIIADPAGAIDGVTDIVTDLAEAITSDPVGAVEDVADAVTGVVDSITGDALDALGIADIDGGILDPVIDLAEDVLADPVGAVDDIIADPVGTVEDVVDMAGGIVEDALADPAGAVEDVADVVTDVVDGLGGGILEPVVDTVEDVLADPAGAVGEIVADPVGAVGDLAGGLLGLGGDSEEGDTDLVIDTGLEIGGTELPGIAEDINLDPVEGLVGDIDIDLSADGVLASGGGEDSLLAEVDVDMLGLDVLEGDADFPLDVSEGLDGGDIVGLLGGEDGEDDGGGWTEAIAGDGEGLFGDVIDGIGGEGDALPDPGGTVAEGLGVLDIDPVGAIGGGGLAGGLFG